MEKILQQEIESVYVQGAPTKLTGSAQENKRVFDKLPLMIIEKINDIIDELSGGSGADSISGEYRGVVMSLQDIVNMIITEIDDRYTKADIDLIVADGMNIDCGDFEPDLLSHQMDIHAHSNMIVDASGIQARALAHDLETHMSDENAHEQLIIDGSEV